LADKTIVELRTAIRCHCVCEKLASIRQNESTPCRCTIPIDKSGL